MEMGTKEHPYIYRKIDMIIQAAPPVVGWLYIIPHVQNFQIEITRFPNAWHRFWARVLLGWSYEHKKG